MADLRITARVTSGRTEAGRTRASRALVALVAGSAAFMLVGCSTDAAESRATGALDREVRASDTHADPTSPAGTPCPSAQEATAALAGSGHAVSTPVCESDYVAGAASNNQVDFSYLLVASGGGWQRASADVQSEVCTTNPQRLSAAFVTEACDD